MTEQLDARWNAVMELSEKYENAYAMYIEYPHKSAWTSQFDGADVELAIQNLVRRWNPPILLYVHIPFCPRQCFYCSCSTTITSDYSLVQDYMKHLYREIAMIKAAYIKAGALPNIGEIHLGGGSPTILQKPEFEELLVSLSSIANLKDLTEFAIEIDPRVASMELLRYYHGKGITRISFGVQEFNHEVQVSINRVQPVDLLESLMTDETRSYFKGINFDIMWGLPKQTEESFAKTMETVARLAPDRIALLKMHYVPELKKHQGLMRESDLPSVKDKVRLIMRGSGILQANGYTMIGLDHYAKDDDSLITALNNRTLAWNPLGYRHDRCVDTIGVGSSSSSRITDGYYFQNLYGADEYMESIDAGKLPVFRGYKLNRDDVIRRDVIHNIRTYHSCSLVAIEDKYDIVFGNYFKSELEYLSQLEKDGLVTTGKSIDVTEAGRFFTFHICRIFDNKE